MTAKITEFTANGRGSRRRSFVVDGITVMVEPHDDDDNAARELAEMLSTARITILDLRTQIKKLEMHMPPKAPVRLLGPGCVRMRDGAVYLLNQRAKGWASWGVRCDGWDDLFRRFNVVVTAYGTDEHGAWWMVENAGVSS